MYEYNYDRVYRPDQIVETEELDFYPRTEEISTLLDLIRFANKYDVDISHLSGVKGPGGYKVRFKSTYLKIYRLLSEEYTSDYEGTEKINCIHMLLGDPIANHLFAEGGCLNFATKAELQEALRTRFPRDPYAKASIEDYNWPEHWLAVGIKSPSGEGTSESARRYEEVNEVAMTTLVEAGYEAPSGEDDPVDFAHAYLMLAFMHCPDLMDVMPKLTVSQEVLKARAIEAIQKGEIGEARDLLNEVAERITVERRVYLCPNCRTALAQPNEEHVCI